MSASPLCRRFAEIFGGTAQVVNGVCSNRLGGNALSGAFSLRSDITMTMLMLIQNTFSLAHEGIKIMIKNRWMEKPPQIEDRKQLAKLNK